MGRGISGLEDSYGIRNGSITSQWALEIVPLLPGKQFFGCKWIFTIKFLPDGSVDWLKAQLVTKGYIQTYC